MQNHSTICAISTASGKGGIAVIRVSGPKAIEGVESIFTPIIEGKKLSNQKGYTLHFGNIVQQGLPIDEVMVSMFRAPHSFTGEDSIEISCHGSLYIQQAIIQLLLQNGIMLAAPGEFTQRAFINGKMDLTQAEAVVDLIASTTQSAHRLAMQQMKGGFSAQLSQIREKILDFVSLIELELDFSEEDVNFADREALLDLAQTLSTTIQKLIRSFEWGNVIKNGIPVAIVGQTNAGKSTLLNLLLSEERAIVSDIHGTTRDSIEETITLQGICFRFIDTAGIRTTEDQIESLGIERTFKKIEQSTLVIWVIDSSCPTEIIQQTLEQITPHIQNQKLLILLNKKELVSDVKKNDILQILQPIDAPQLFITAKEPSTLPIIEEQLIELSQLPEIEDQEIVITNLRHMQALSQTQTALLRAIGGLESNLSGDFISQDLRESMYHIGTITGSITTDEILGNIFSRFCIGK